MFRIDDIVAALILALCMMRRLEVLGVSTEQNPHVPAPSLESWRQAQLRAYHLCAVACVLKVGLSLLWWWFSPPSPWLQVGGLTIFALWVGALTFGWRLSTEARALRNQLGIRGRTAAQKP